MTCSNFFLGQLIQNSRTTGRLVANNLVASPFFQLCNQLWWKTCIGKGLERLGNMQTHHFPMTCHRILACTGLPQFTIMSQRLCHCLHLLQRMEIGHAQLLQIGNDKAIHTFGNMAQGISSCITIFSGIRHSASPQ